MAVDLSDSEREAVTGTLRAAGCVFAEDEARLIARAAATPAQLDELVAQRCAGRPLEHLLGFAELCGVRVTVNPGVFVPRQRTALLAREAIAVTSADDVVVDLCCGSGAVGMVVRSAVPHIELWAGDLDPAAVRCARANLEPLGGHVVEGDLFDALPTSLVGRVATLVVNAPYVPTDAMATMPPEARDHEPRLSLDGGHDGAEVHRRIATGAARWLSPTGHLLIETGRRQSGLTAEAMVVGGLVPRVAIDDEIDGTVVIGTRPRASG